jgi:hypothetical protein
VAGTNSGPVQLASRGIITGPVNTLVLRCHTEQFGASGLTLFNAKVHLRLTVKFSRERFNNLYYVFLSSAICLAAIIHHP